MKLYSEDKATYRFEPSISPPRFSTSFDYRYSSLDSSDSPYDLRLSPLRDVGPPSPSSRIHIVLSTPSPSAIAKEAESGILSFGSRSPSPSRQSPASDRSASISQPGSDLYQRRRQSSVKRVSERKPSLRSRSASPHHNTGCPLHSQSVRSNRFTSKSPSPKRSIERPPVRRNLFHSERDRYNRNSRSPTGSVNSLNSYREEEIIYYTPRLRSISPRSHTTYRRNSSYSTEDSYLNSRNQSRSPQRPIYSTNTKPEYPNYARELRPSSPLRSVSLLKDIFARRESYDEEETEEILKDILPGYDEFARRNSDRRFSSLPRLRERERISVRKVFRESPERSNFADHIPYVPKYSRNSPSDTHSEPDHRPTKTYSTYSMPTGLSRDSDRQKSPPKFSNKMPSTQRRSSDEDSSYRRPLTTLREDDYRPFRRSSNDRRERSLEPDYDEDIAEQRRLSEAGVRKLSTDAAAILTDPSETDSFIIGDRVWVGGTKPGSISFIGETKFAPGEWAGVTLDQYIGKNDGSVGGIRYFQCEARKGIFSRLTRLTRVPLSDYELDQIGRRQSLSRSQSPVSKKVTPVAPTPLDTSQRGSITDRKPLTTPSVRNGTSAVFRKSSSPSPGEARIGEFVVINSATGIKYGTLRFTGKTEFADGIWGGVELDEPIGKNDGSVAGKRYFTCRMKYGLFAPISRISRARKTSGPSYSRSTQSAMKRSGSKESLGASSIASSVVSTNRGMRTSLKPAAKQTTAMATRGLQETLKEKTQHVDQLLRERDLEREELAHLATQMDQAKNLADNFKWQLDQLQMESEEKIHDLNQKLKKYEEERPMFLSKLDAKQKEIDDLTFRFEEESIAKSDLESQCMTDSLRLAELTKKLDSEEQKYVKDVQKQEKKCDQFEDMEIDLRVSIDDFQMKVMGLEQDKECLEKKLEESIEKVKELEALKCALQNTVTEKDQKIELLNSTENTQDNWKSKYEDLLKETQQTNERIQDLTSEIGSLQKSNAELSGQLWESASAVKELQIKEENLTTKTAELEDLKSQLSNSHQMVTSLENANKTLEENQLKADLIDDMKNKLQEAEQHVTCLRESEGTLKEQLQKQKTQLKEFQKNDFEKKFKELQDRFTETENLLSQATTNSNTLSDSEKKSLKKIQEQAADLEKQKNELEQQTIRNKELDLKISDLYSKLEKAELRNSDATEKDAQIQELSQKVDSLEKDVKKASEIKETLEKNSKETEKKLNVKLSEMKNLEQSLQETKAKLSEVEQLLVESKKSEAKQSEELSHKKIELDDKERSLSQLKSTHKTMEELIEQQTNEIKSYENMSEKLHKLEESKNAEAEVLNKLQTDYNATVQALQELQKHHTEQIQAFEQQIQSKDKQFEKSSEEIDSYKNIISANDETLRELNTKLSEYDTTIKSLQESISRYEEKLKLANQSSSDQLIGLNSKIKQLEESLDKSTEEERNLLKLQDGLQLKISDLEKKLQVSEGSITDREDRLQKFEAENTQILQEKDELMNSFKEKSQNLETEIANLKSSLEKQLSDNSELKSSETTLSSDLKIANDKVNDLQSTINKLTEDLKLSHSLQDELASLHHKYNEVTQQNLELNGSLEKEKEANGLIVSEKELISLKMHTLENELKELKSTSEKTIENLQQQIQKNQNDTSEQLAKIQTLEKTKQDLQGTLDDAVTEKTHLKESSEKLQTSIDELTLKINGNDKKISSLEATCSTYEKDLKSVSTDKDTLLSDKNILEGKCKSIQLKYDECVQLKESYENELKQCKQQHEQTLLDLRTDFEKRLKESDMDHKTDQSQYVNTLQVAIEKMKHTMENTKKSLESKMEEMEEEKRDLLLQHGRLECLVASMKKESEIQLNKIDQLENTDSERLTAEMRLEILQLKKEKRNLQEELEKAKDSQLVASTSGDERDILLSMKNERDELRAQVSFLNSIIADHQTEKDRAQNNNESDIEKVKRQVAPRMFCDICDCFDLHDTDECPQQEEPDQGIQLHGERSQSRPYCQSCEVFGHETGECPDETF